MHNASMKVNVRQMADGWSYQVMVTLAPGHYLPVKSAYGFDSEGEAREAGENMKNIILVEKA